jgi:hypothetical protein
MVGKLFVSTRSRESAAVVQLANRTALGGGTLALGITEKIEIRHGVVTPGVVIPVATLPATPACRMQSEPLG